MNRKTSKNWRGCYCLHRKFLRESVLSEGSDNRLPIWYSSSAQHPRVSLDQLRVKIRLHLASQLNLGSDVVPDAVKDESRVANVVAEQLVDMPAPTRCT